MLNKILFTVMILMLAITAGFLATPLPSPLFPDDYSTVILDENGGILRVYLNSHEQWCFPSSPLQIPDKLVQAVVNFEDRRFFSHHGVDPGAVLRAVKQNLTRTKRVSGASTITMQVARLMVPKERTIPHKILEMLQALKIEQRLNKVQILATYLEHAPYGGNIIGYRAASWKYFGKFPEKLTWAEAATLAVLPNSPRLINPVSDSRGLLEKRNRLLKSLYGKNLFDENTYLLALLEPVPAAQKQFPVSAPHLCDWLHSCFPGQTVATTIDRNFQQSCTSLVRDYSAFLNSRGIKNACVLVAETDSGKVRAYVGSQNYFDMERQGMVDGIRSPRSTGSILKPFLYALAMDRGMLLPDTKIPDVPTHYGSFSPANADLTYRGMVTVHDSLTMSLNVPAVMLLDCYGVEDFYGFLKKAGLKNLFRTPDEYGLPLVIGGAEATVWDLAAMFAGLGNLGNFRKISVLQGIEDTAENRLISRGAAWLTLLMLQDVNRPGAENYWHQFSSQWPIAWKTGTSFGFRDAWAIGVTPQWTIAVWAGNFTGEGNPELFGARSAGHLLFDIFNTLPRNPFRIWFDKPESSLQSLKICQDSGYLAGQDCPQTVEREAPLSMDHLKVCPYHRKVFLNPDRSETVCSLCWGTSGEVSEQYLVYPPEVVQYLRETGGAPHTIPSHRKSCPSLGAYNP
ncbi:MAG: penicillin-binding protein 1C, partial [Candidatus Wallbacteria bacterium]|nr:penicillin-binding protein 1C [Candidatus Wallbacteria bacterium]